MELGFMTKMRWNTYQAQLNKCTCDLRFHRISAQTWWSSGIFPQLYVITVNNSDKKYKIYINEYVRVVDIYKSLIALKELTIDDVDNTVLKTDDGQHVFKLYNTIKTTMANYELFLHKEDRSPDLFQIFIKALTANRMTFEVQPQDPIQLIKHKIFLHYSIPIEQQRLLFAGKELEDEQTLDSCNIKKESTLHLGL